MTIRILLLLAYSFLSACDVPADDADSAVEVTIIRDEWGVPHIFGPTDASVVFGAAYAQAEDNWPQVEDNFIRSLGRAAEIRGDEALMDDFLARGMEIEAVSKAEYERSPDFMRELYDAYSRGFNAYLVDHPGAKRSLLEEIKPWYTLALIRFKYHHNEFLNYAGLSMGQTRRLMADSDASFGDLSGSAWSSDLVAPNGERHLGSNEWAISGSRTETGYPMLLINPHVSFFGLSTYWEVHLESEEGLSFSGLTRFGFMLPYMGNNAHHGWAYTDNYGDYGDLYRERFSEDESTYLFGDEWREIASWTDSIWVKGSSVPEVFSYQKTHHGPILGTSYDGNPLAVKLAKYEKGGWFEQWYHMMKATSFVEWKEAASALDVSYMNTAYADREGNIYYLYNHSIPKRSERFNWSGIVDGTNPATEWDGYHTIDELPQVLNPESGFVQNTNSTPFGATDGIGIRSRDYPDYMVGNETDNRRARRSRQVLASIQEASLESFSIDVWDTYLLAADEWLGNLFTEFDRARARTPDRAARFTEPIQLLRQWDRTADQSSVATTLFVLWGQQGRGRGGLTVLARVMQDLESTHGTWRVEWGDVNRLQRPDASGDADFNYDLPSVPVSGAPGWMGSVFTYTTGAETNGVRYGIHGNSFVKVVAFGEDTEAKSLFVFGQNGDPESEHYFDQAQLYSAGEMKRAWFSREDVEAHAVRTYSLKTDF